jgi:hypothetical protein
MTVRHPTMVYPTSGRQITLDADTGELLERDLPTINTTEEDDPGLRQLTEWARAEDGANPDVPLPTLLERRAASRSTVAAQSAEPVK